MKIRNGFVSNSSSSSFILTYNKNRVLTDPNDIVEYIKNSPDNPIIFNGGEWGEGDDIFELDEEQKSLIRKFPKEFIKTNTGTKTCTDYEYCGDDIMDHLHLVEKQIPKVTAYVDGVNLIECSSDYRDFDVDMSDVEKVELPDDYYNRKDDPEIKKLIEKADNWYKIAEQREKAARTEYESKLKADYKTTVAKEQNIPEEQVASEVVWVSNSSCNPDYSYISDFAERYLTSEMYLDEDEPSYYHIRKRDRSKATLFAITYNEVITDKNEIADYICNSLNTATGKCYLIWTNAVFNSIFDDEDTMFDFYEVGPQEAEVFKDNRDNFLKNDREALLFVGSSIIIESGSLENISGNKVSLSYGRLVVISEGTDVRDFKKNVSEGEKEWY